MCVCRGVFACVCMCVCVCVSNDDDFPVYLHWRSSTRDVSQRQRPTVPRALRSDSCVQSTIPAQLLHMYIEILVYNYVKYDKDTLVGFIRYITMIRKNEFIKVNKGFKLRSGVDEVVINFK